jgi:hypothetical protein
VLAASTTIGNYLLPPRIAELLRQAPQAEVDLRIDNSAGVVAAVQRLDVDAGLIEGPCHERGLQVTAWQQDPLVIVAAADAPAAGRWTNCAAHAGCCASPAPAPAKPSNRRCCRTCAASPRPCSWAIPKRSSRPPSPASAWPAFRATRWKSRWLSAACACSRPAAALQRTLWLVRHPGKQWLPGLQALLGEVVAGIGPLREFHVRARCASIRPDRQVLQRSSTHGVDLPCRPRSTPTRAECRSDRSQESVEGGMGPVASVRRMDAARAPMDGQRPRNRTHPAIPQETSF